MFLVLPMWAASRGSWPLGCGCLADVWWKPRGGSEESWPFEGACQWVLVMEVGTVTSEETTALVTWVLLTHN